jgi:phosphate-selective porin
MTGHTSSKRNFGINALLAAASWLTLAVPSSLGQAGAAAAPYQATMTFDVASVRENKNADPNLGITISGEFVPHTTMFRAMNWSINNLVGFAYGANGS